MDANDESQNSLFRRYALILRHTHTTKVAAVLPPTRSSDKAVLGELKKNWYELPRGIYFLFRLAPNCGVSLKYVFGWEDGKNKAMR
jgi:hypothetical protein